jgi:hypothetical protein
MEQTVGDVKVGVFWVSKGVILGKAIPLTSAEEGVPGLLDSNDNHSEVWEDIKPQISPASLDLEYFDIPRGRVLYSKEKAISLVYMDSLLHKKSIKALVTEFFELSPKKTKWCRDEHYTTNQFDLDKLLNDF